MSSVHGTYEASVKSAGPVQLASAVAAEQVRQTTIDAADSVVGLNLINGNAAYVTAVAAANIAKLESLANAEKAKQASVAAARELLRADTVGDGTKF